MDMPCSLRMDFHPEAGSHCSILGNRKKRRAEGHIYWVRERLITMPACTLTCSDMHACQITTLHDPKELNPYSALLHFWLWFRWQRNYEVRGEAHNYTLDSAFDAGISESVSNISVSTFLELYLNQTIILYILLRFRTSPQICLCSKHVLTEQICKHSDTSEVLCFENLKKILLYLWEDLCWQ